jgi:hypothetical protein
LEEKRSEERKEEEEEERRGEKKRKRVRDETRASSRGRREREEKGRVGADWRADGSGPKTVWRRLLGGRRGSEETTKKRYNITRPRERNNGNRIAKGQNNTNNNSLDGRYIHSYGYAFHRRAISRYSMDRLTNNS